MRLLTRAFIAVVIIGIAGALALLGYGYYTTRGDYEADLVVVRLDSEYTITGLTVRAKPEEASGVYAIALKFEIKTTVESTFLTRKEAYSIASNKVKVLCPEEYGYWVDRPYKHSSMKTPWGVKTEFTIPVYVILKNYVITLKPGVESTLKIDFKPGCVIFNGDLKPEVELQPSERGFIINIDNTKVLVKDKR